MRKLGDSQAVYRVSGPPASLLAASLSLFAKHFGSATEPRTVYAPGRVNLIGEHIDYHNLPVLPIAIGRGIFVAFRARHDAQVACISPAVPTKPVSFTLSDLETSRKQPGDWRNYVIAAALIARESFGISRGIDAVAVSDLPIAAGLSSSSALLVAFTLALLAANGVVPSLADLMSLLPEGEHFVGTRGGGMDHAAILASTQGHALLVHFNPFTAFPVPVPAHWRFLVADSLHAAEKSSALAMSYNQRRQAGTDALRTLGLPSYREALKADLPACLARLADAQQRDAFSHVTSEARRVEDSVSAMQQADLETFGRMLNESHQSLRNQLRVSTPAVDALVTAAVKAGAAGARITGAGFGGCIVAACHQDSVEHVRDTLKRHHYAGLPAEMDKHLFVAQPASGALEILDV